MQQPARHALQPEVERLVQLVRQPRPEHDFAHQQEQGDGDQHEVGGRAPHHLADEIPERPVGVSKAGDHAEQAECCGDVDAGAEKQAEQPDQRDDRPDRQGAGGRPAEHRRDHRDDQHHHQEDDGDHAFTAFCAEASRCCSMPSTASVSSASST
jgi:hypothetical protein